MKYSDLPKMEQPSWRLRELGATTLSMSEALATSLWITDTDAAQALNRLYEEYGSLISIPREKILSIKGLGARYADAIDAMAEVIRRETASLFKRDGQKKNIGSPGDAAALVQYEMSAMDHEELWVIVMDQRSNVKRIVKLYKGSVNSSQVRIGEVFRDAIKDQASSIILVHNHPSGDPLPSSDDVALTRGVVQAGKLMDIDVLDHLVIGAGKYTSMKERGLGFGF